MLRRLCNGKIVSVNRRCHNNSTISAQINELFTAANFNIPTLSADTCTPATDWSGRYSLTSSSSTTDNSGASPLAKEIDIDEIAVGIMNKQRRFLSRAVTLAESSNPHHSDILAQLLRRLTSRGRLTDRRPHQRRIAISGSPGAGKSCFIEALGWYLVNQGLTVGVLAVDPSSAVTGGSILGDKTRMEKLGSHPNAFIRPSPSKGHLGGVTARCWETLELFEAANFDVTFVETVGVGQSETEAAQLTDLFVLLTPPAAGDELQGVKRGIVEMADAIVVTKADGPREQLAETAQAHYKRAVMYASTDRRGGATDCLAQKPVITVSSETGARIRDAWNTLDALWQTHAASGELSRRREEQRLAHFKSYVEHEVVARAWRLADASRHHTTGEKLSIALSDAVARGDMTPREAGNALLSCLLPNATSQ